MECMHRKFEYYLQNDNFCRFITLFVIAHISILLVTVFFQDYCRSVLSAKSLVSYINFFPVNINHFAANSCLVSRDFRSGKIVIRLLQIL